MNHDHSAVNNDAGGDFNRDDDSRVDQSISFEVDHDHSVVDDDDGDVISFDQPSLRSENNVVDHDHSGLDNDEQNNSEIESDVFDMAVKQLLSICFVPTSPPSEDAKPFETDKDFREYFNKYPSLMRSQLASYISTKPSFSNLTEAEEFRNALPSYHVKGYALSTKSLQEDFYSNFKKEHFVQTRNEDEKEGSAYIRPMSIHPKDLYTFNKEGFDNFRNSIANIAAFYHWTSGC